jgi:lipopolysaccharide transport protein LptA
VSKFVNTFFLTMFLVSAAFSQNAGFGSIASDRNKPIQFTSDSLIFNQKKNIAELFDKVEITQGESILSAEHVKVIYSKTDNKLEKIFAGINVVFKSGNDIAKAENAIYSFLEDTISLSGNAKLFQGSNSILADQILINTKTGLTQMLGSVKTILSPSAN